MAEKRVSTQIIFAVAFATCLLFATAAQATPQCGQRSQIIGYLAKTYQEAPVGIGVTGKGALVELLTDKNSKTWSILITYPNGVTCLIASGEGWRDLVWREEEGA